MPRDEIPNQPAKDVEEYRRRCRCRHIDIRRPHIEDRTVPAERDGYASSPSTPRPVSPMHRDTYIVVIVDLAFRDSYG
jgi:hypothetical protein